MSEIRKEIGKIKKVEFGMGGYQDAQFGFRFELGGKSWGVNDFWGQWATKRLATAEWTEQDRLTYLGKDCMRVLQLLQDAKVESLQDLIDVPIECSFEGFNILSSWRILTEVI